MALEKRIGRTFFEHKSRYMGSILLIVLSCMLYTAFNIAGPNVKDNIDKYKKDNVLEDAQFVLQKPLDNIDELEKQYRLVLEEKKTYDIKFDSHSTLRIVKEPKKVNKYSIVEGKPLKGENDILIEKKFASAHKLSIGDTIKVSEKEFKIVGISVLPDYLYPLRTDTDMVPNFDVFGTAIVSGENFENIKESFTYYSVKFERDNVKDFKEELSKDNLILKWTDKNENTKINTIDGDIDAFVVIGNIVPICIIVLTCLLVAFFFWRQLKSEYVYIGTIYALGYRKKEVLGHYLSYPLLLSFIGGTVGTLLGLAFSKILFNVFEVKYSLPEIVMGSNNICLFISFSIPFVFLMPTSFFVIMNVLKISPLNLIKGGSGKTKVGFIERKLKLNKFKFDTKFKIREMVRSIPRAVIVIAGVNFAALLLLFGFGANDSIDHLYNVISNNLKQQYFYRFTDFQFDKPEKGEAVSYSVFEASDKNNNKINLSIYGISANSKYTNLKDLKGEPVEVDKNIVSFSLAKKLGLEEGDHFKVVNKYNSKEYELKVEKISDDYLYQAFIPLERFNSLFGYPKESYLGIFSMDKLDFDSTKSVDVMITSEQNEGYKSLTQVIKVVLGFITVISFLIAVCVIYIVTVMIIDENKTGISLLKILGYSKKKVFSLILNSNTVLVILGFVLAIPLALLLISGFFDIVSTKMIFAIPTRLEKINYLFVFIIILVTYETSKRLCRRRIMSVSMSDLMKDRAG